VSRSLLNFGGRPLKGAATGYTKAHGPGGKGSQPSANGTEAVAHLEGSGCALGESCKVWLNRGFFLSGPWRPPSVAAPSRTCAGQRCIYPVKRYLPSAVRVLDIRSTACCKILGTPSREALRMASIALSTIASTASMSA
jgi:hypothetical protein